MSNKPANGNRSQSSRENERLQVRKAAHDKKEELSRTIAENVSHNLRKLIQYLDWSQAKMADALDLAEAAVSGYIHGKAGETVIPRPEVLALITQIAAERKNLRFTVDEFMFERLQFDVARNKPIEYTTDRGSHLDYTGNYYFYFFDQSKAGATPSTYAARKLRYGVISIYQEMRRIGEYGIYTCAKFFKEAADAYAFRETLDAVAAVDEDDKRAKILALYRGDKEFYTGEVTFNDNHVFVELNSGYFGDRVLAVFYAPRKKADSAYIGGLGSMVSVSHGLAQMPVAQKVILSDVRLKASSERIASMLRMELQDIQMSEEAEDLYGTYQMLTRDSKDELSVSQYLDEEDRQAIFRSRLTRVVRTSADKYLNAICSVTEEDDAAVYQMIKNSVVRGRNHEFS